MFKVTATDELGFLNIGNQLLTTLCSLVQAIPSTRVLSTSTVGSVKESEKVLTAFFSKNMFKD